MYKNIAGDLFSLSTNRKRKFLAKFCQSVSRKGIKTMGRGCFVGHDGAVVLWDELCGQSVHGWVGGTGGRGDNCPLPPQRTSCSLVGCVLQGVIFSDL